MPTLLRRYVWWIVAAVLLIVSYAIVKWAKTSPSYDAYGWLVWGHQTLHGALDLGGAPSWKPLPFLFTVPFSLFGTHAVRLWMVFDAWVSLAGVVFAGRIAYRLVGGERAGRPVAWIAAIVAGLGLLGIDQYPHYILTSQSDPMITTFVLAAIDLHLIRRQRLAFVCLVLASLGRPEVWPFLGLYAIWVWREVPGSRLVVVGGLLVIPALWFGVPEITNGRPFVAGQLAQFSVHRIIGNKFTGTFNRYFGLTGLPIKLLALVAVGIAVARRNWTVVVLGAGAFLWVLVELAFALHGWPALPRYMFESGAVQCVLAGVGLGWIALEVSQFATRARPTASLRWVSIPVALLIVAVLVPGAVARVRDDHRDLKAERWRSTQIVRLQEAIRAVGGYRHIRHCGKPVTYVGMVSALAYNLKMNVGFVGHRPRQDTLKRVPVVLFTQRANGWALDTFHIRHHRRAACANLSSTVIFDAAHPSGAVVSDSVARALGRAT